MTSTDRVASASPELEEKTFKRKRDGEAAERRRLKKQKKKQHQDMPNDEDLDDELGVNLSFARMDPQLIADHVARQTKKFNLNLTQLEQDELRIAASDIKDMSTFKHKRATARLPDFLKIARAEHPNSMDLAKAPSEKGTPHTLLITGAGLRAADLTRMLRVFQTKDCVVAKLFAKHIKLAEAVTFTKATRMGIGVGTPARISDLLEAGALTADKLERIVVDFSHIDIKKRGVMDNKDIQLPLVKLLQRKELKSRYRSAGGNLDLLFY